MEALAGNLQEQLSPYVFRRELPFIELCIGIEIIHFKAIDKIANQKNQFIEILILGFGDNLTVNLRAAFGIFFNSGLCQFGILMSNEV